MVPPSSASNLEKMVFSSLRVVNRPGLLIAVATALEEDAPFNGGFLGVALRVGVGTGALRSFGAGASVADSRLRVRRGGGSSAELLFGGIFSLGHCILTCLKEGSLTSVLDSQCKKTSSHAPIHPVAE